MSNNGKKLQKSRLNIFAGFHDIEISIKDTQMGPLFILVSPCFTENVNITCKVMSFLCNLDNFFFQENVFLFKKSNFKMALI